jgi:uncharacterized protein YndB with AHSA1/START domain
MTTETTVAARVSHRFTASPEQVFDAWLDPEKVMRWMAAVREMGAPGEMVRVSIDARVGGRFSFVDLRDDEEVDHVGEYLEIDRPRRLVFTWSVPRYSPDVDRVVVEIAPLETGCELTLTHELHPDWADYLDRTERAWALMITAIGLILAEDSGEA